MDTIFNIDIFYGHLVKGQLRAALAYLNQFPDQQDRQHRYSALFESSHYLTYKVDSHLNRILTIYQQYFREAFYVEITPDQAAENMRRRFVSLFDISDQTTGLSEIENTQIAPAFEAQGFHFLGGRTGGYWGPYIWSVTHPHSFHVALPNGSQEFTVSCLDGFLLKSWLDYLSFGEVGTGGWTDGDGMIHCVKSSYDLHGESFTVSLLKHEAQHVMDLSRYPQMSSEDLEYRAKLVELIYSEKRNLLCQFLHEADSSRTDNGHGIAAARIIREFARASEPTLHWAEEIPIEQIQSAAAALFAASDLEMSRKYTH